MTPDPTSAYSTYGTSSGYALVRRPDGRLVHRSDQVAPGDSIEVLLGAGALDATVTATAAERDG